jgi:hypothetical protein
MRLSAACLAAFLLAAPAAAQTRTVEMMASRDTTFDAGTVGYLMVDTGNRQNYGSASLIDRCHIKTAAHMFRSQPVGAVNLAARAQVSFGYERKGDAFTFASTHRVTQVRLNPQFNPARTQQPGFDVAVGRIEPCLEGADVAIDRVSALGEIGKMSRRFAVVGFVPDKQLRPRLFALRACLWTGDGDQVGILLNCPGKSGMSGGSVFMQDGDSLVDVGVFTSSVSVNGKTHGAFSPLSANRTILPAIQP